MTDFHARGPHGDRDFGSFREPLPESKGNFLPEGFSAPGSGSAGAENPVRDASDRSGHADGGAGESSEDSAAGGHRRRRRGGRGRRNSRRGSEAGNPAQPTFDPELAVEPPLPEAEFPPFDGAQGEHPDSKRADAPSDLEQPQDGAEPGRKRRRRGRRRGRGRGRDGSGPETLEGNATWPADSSLESAGDVAGVESRPALEHPADPLLPEALPSGARPRRRGRGRGRGEQRTDSPEAAAQIAGNLPSASALEQDSSGPRAAKRRRRGSRGGRGRQREQEAAQDSVGPLGVEALPFEDDDFPAVVVPTPVARPIPRRKRQDGRGRNAGRGPRGENSPEVPEEQVREPAKPALRRKNVILVNASDREEVRVAVVEGQQIVDFQMTVRKHKLLVNDIYRGRVVNLEPAIGAAFVDFGQGRNGFLHTSDVLSVYGEKDFTLQKLMSAKIDPDEWEGDDSAVETPADARQEPRDRVAPAGPEVASPDAAADLGEHGAENSDDFAEIVDDHHELHVADAAHSARAEEHRHAEHSHGDHHEDLFSSVREDEHGDLDDGAEHEPMADLPEGTLLDGEPHVAPEAGDEAALADSAPAREGRDQRGRRSLRKTRGAARTTQGGARGRHGQSQGNGTRRQARPRRPITELLEKGQVVVVQITKDAIGEKGPTLTTYISIPGRHLVLMPSMARTGVSRKIEDEKERRRLKKILASLDNLSPGMGVIVRTAGVGCTRDDLQRDLDYLLALWGDFEKRLNLGRGPAPLYEESDVAIRTVRDLFNSSTEAVIVDDPEVFQRVREFTARLMTPEDLDRIQLHDGARPLFHAYGVEQDFERIFSRRIELPSGGSIVFDQTEALVAIDVNSGKTRSEGFEFEEIALKTNLEAAPEIARQIRLRDLGGIIVCDFIDMQRAGSRRAVERAFGQALADDRARSKLGRISQFGLLELTRQRLGPGLSRMLFHNCVRCRGSGRLRTVESRSGSILRRLGAALPQKGFGKVEVRAAADVVDYLKANCTSELKDLEGRNQKQITLAAVSDQLEDSVLRYLRPDGREVRPGGRRKR